MEEMSQKPEEETKDYIFNQTMLRIKDPRKSLNFYTDIFIYSNFWPFDKLDPK